MVSATLGGFGEFSLIKKITADLVLGPDVVVGPGDDGAVLSLQPPLVTSLDVLVEGVHFRRDWSPARDVGRKAVAVNVSDLEAMGARATALVVGFSAPPSLELSWALEFAGGLTEEATAAGVSLIGGDVTRARDITISVTVLGTLDGRAPGSAVGRAGRRRGGGPRAVGLGGGRAGRPRPRVPLAAGGGGGAPGTPGQLRSGGDGRRGRRDGDDRRLRRAARRPRPHRGRLRGHHRAWIGAPSRSPSRCRRWRRPPAPTRTRWC